MTRFNEKEAVAESIISTVETIEKIIKNQRMVCETIVDHDIKPADDLMTYSVRLIFNPIHNKDGECIDSLFILRFYIDNRLFNSKEKTTQYFYAVEYITSRTFESINISYTPHVIECAHCTVSDKEIKTEMNYRGVSCIIDFIQYVLNAGEWFDKGRELGLINPNSIYDVGKSIVQSMIKENDRLAKPYNTNYKVTRVTVRS